MFRSLVLAPLLVVLACGGAREQTPRAPGSASTEPTPGEPAPAAESSASSASSAGDAGDSEVARAYLSSIAAGNRSVDEALATFTDDTEYHAPSSPESKSLGKAALQKRLETMRAGFPDAKLEVKRLLSSGDVVVAQLVWRGTHRGEFAGVRPTGKTGGYEMLQLSTLSQGKKASTIVYSNPATLLTQIGVMSGEAPSPPALPSRPELVTAAPAADAEAAVRGYYTAVSTGSAKLAGLLADGAVLHDHVAERSLGKSEIGAFVAEQRAAFPDLESEVEQIVAAGDFVAARVVERGTHRGKLGPLKPTGRKVTLHGADVFEVRNGRIASIDRYRDVLELYRQIGLFEARAH
jgi:steroid delta-isomerase-like uncharacterized protein